MIALSPNLSDEHQTGLPPRQALPITVTACNFCRHPEPWQLRPHRHEDLHELYLIHHGSVQAHVEEEIALGTAGDLMHHPLGREHYPQKVGDQVLQFLHIRWRGGDELMTAWQQNPVHDRDGRIRYLMDYLHSLRREGTEVNTQQLRALLVQAILREGLRLQSGRVAPLVERVSRFVREHLSEPLELEDLADAMHMSKHHFARKFRQESGQTPMRFVTEIRLEVARQLLLNTDLTIAAVAEEVGMNSAAQFSHVFKRHLRVSPGSLRAGKI